MNQYIALHPDICVNGPSTGKFIRELFAHGFYGTYPEFQIDLDVITEAIFKGRKMDYIEAQGPRFYADLENVFTNNIDQLLQETPLGPRIIMGSEITHYFDGSEELTWMDLPYGAKYLKEIGKDGKPVVEELSTQLLLDSLFTSDSQLFVCHDEDKRFIVVDLAQLKEKGLRQLPEGLIEGYYHTENDEYHGQIFHNVFLTAKGSKLLLEGKVSFNGDGSISIRPDRWYDSFIAERMTATSIPQNDMLRQAQLWGDIEKHVFSLEHLVVIGHSSGRRYTVDFQDTTTPIHPAKPYDQYLPELSGSATSKQDSLEYQLPSQKEIEKIYGADFTHHFNELFDLLFSPDIRVENQYAIPKVHLYLDKLNGYFKGMDFKHFILGPSEAQINTRVNELFRNSDGTFDKERFLMFLWKNEADTFRKTYIDAQNNQKEFTTKVWLSCLLHKILAYSGGNIEIIKARKKIEQVQSLPDVAVDLNLGVLNEYTDEEAKLAEGVFDALQNIFGHFTLRLPFANMLDYYITPNGVGIKIIPRPGYISKVDPNAVLGEYFDHIDYVTATSRRGELIKQLRPESKLKHFFGYFFLNSYLRLDLTNGEEYRIRSRIGALVGIDPSYLSQATITTKGIRTISHERMFSELLGDAFTHCYTRSYQSRDRATAFIDDQTSLLDHLSDRVQRKLEALVLNKVIGKAEQVWYYSKVMRQLRLGVFHGKNHPETKDGVSMRGLINDFLNGKEQFAPNPHAYSFDLEFSGIPSPTSAGDFTLRITQEELLGIDFRYHGDVQDFYGDDTAFTRLKRMLVIQGVKEVARRLEKLILDDTLTGGKVRIFPLLSNDKKNGYYYAYPSGKGAKYYYIPRSDQHDGYFDIDLSNPNSEDRYILEHIAYMMIGHDCAFIMTKLDDSIVQRPDPHSRDKTIVFKEILCAFNREGFLNINEILSLIITRTLFPKMTTYRVNIGRLSFPSYKFQDEMLVEAWQNDLSFTSGGSNTDFTWYMNNIRENRNAFYVYLKTILNL